MRKGANSLDLENLGIRNLRIGLLAKKLTLIKTLTLKFISLRRRTLQKLIMGGVCPATVRKLNALNFIVNALPTVFKS
jgi:hypothetical protein